MNMLEQAEAAKAELRKCEKALSDFGVSIYESRHPDEKRHLEGYGLRRWYSSLASDCTDWEGDYAHRLPNGTPILVLEYYHSRWETDETVVVSLDYLDDPSTAIERDRDARAERDRVHQEKRAAAKIISAQRAAEERRAQYEKLKAEFDG